MKLKESRKLDVFLDFAQELKKTTTVEHEADSDINKSQSNFNKLKEAGKYTRVTRDIRQDWDYPNCWDYREY